GRLGPPARGRLQARTAIVAFLSAQPGRCVSRRRSAALPAGLFAVNKRARQRLELAGMAALGGLAVWGGVARLPRPLTPEQSSSFELARRWWQENLIPYRDTPDTRPPGIHFLRLLAGIFFGAHPRSLRILEIIAVIAAGMSAAQIAAKK